MILHLLYCVRARDSDSNQIAGIFLSVYNGEFQLIITSHIYQLIVSR